MALAQSRIFVDKRGMSGEITGIIIKIILTVSRCIACGDIAGEIVIVGLPRIQYKHANKAKQSSLKQDILFIEKQLMKYQLEQKELEQKLRELELN